MAEIVSINQRIVTGVRYPRGVYSRVMSCMTLMDAPGNEHGFTPPVGINVWLLGVDVWVTLDHSVVAGGVLNFRILYGAGTPATPAAMLTWENILPVYWTDGTIQPWSQAQPFHHQHWDMNRYFEQAGQRFGFWLQGAAFVGTLRFVASFEISEG